MAEEENKEASSPTEQANSGNVEQMSTTGTPTENDAQSGAGAVETPENEALANVPAAAEASATNSDTANGVLTNEPAASSPAEIKARETAEKALEAKEQKEKKVREAKEASERAKAEKVIYPYFNLIRQSILALPCSSPARPSYASEKRFGSWE